MVKGIKHTINALILIGAIVLGIFSGESEYVSAASKKEVVRVGVFELPNFTEKTTAGSYSGYCIDYLNELANTADWSYEYVPVESFKEGQELLREQKIDLLAPTQHTQERDQEFLFGNYMIGTEFTVLLTRSDEEQYAYEDFEKLNGQKVAVASDSPMTDFFFEYEKINGFVMKPDYYDTPEEAMDALHNGVADFAVVNLMRITDQDKVLARFNPQPIYFMSWKGNDELVKELDSSMATLQNSKPSLIYDLIDEYYPIYKVSYLTKEERQFIAQTGTINVGYIANRIPFSYQDEDGKFAGMTRQIMDRIQADTGLRFNYVALPEGNVDYDYLRENEIYLVTGVENNKTNLMVDGLHISNPYLQMSKVMVGKKNVLFDKEKSAVLAINSGSSTLATEIEDYYPAFTIKNYDSIEECFDAVKNGNANFVLINQYTADYYLSIPKYENLEIIPVEGIADNLCVSALSFQEKGSEDTYYDSSMLVDIINVGISQISEEDTNTIIVNSAMTTKYHHTFFDYFYRYEIVFVPLAGAIVIVFLMMLQIMSLRNKNLKVIEESEHELKSITDNINGGVVVLTVTKEDHLIISYANVTALEMLGYTEKNSSEIIGNSYLKFIHPDDVKKALEIEEQVRVEGSRRAIPLRLLRVDGTYVLTMFSGTYTVSSDGHMQLYCVIMDVTEQEAIHKKVVMQEKRFRVLMEQSHDIIYQLDLATGEIQNTDYMEQMLGWSFPEHISRASCKKISAIWKIHKEDVDILDTTFNKLIEEKCQTECRVRILTQNGTYKWARIFRCPLCDERNEILSVVGRIEDADQEMKEKEQLEEKSRLDSMTGLLNKTTFMMEVQENLNRGIINYTMIFIDLDHFKSVNDTLGHLIGDQAIKDASEKLKIIFENKELISRFGGDEFCVFIKNVSVEDLEERLTITLRRLQQTYENEGQSVTITGSIGAAYVVSECEDLEQVLLAADSAVYNSKKNGRNQYTIIDL